MKTCGGNGLKDTLAKCVVAVRVYLCIWIDGKWVDVKSPWNTKDGQQLCFKFWLLIVPFVTD